jgi:large subunit ribosomal protein L23
MADITDIKEIVYTEKTNEIADRVVVVKTSTRVNKNQLKEVFWSYFGVKPLKVNSMRMHAKEKKFKGVLGTRPEYKKFYVTVPEGARLEKLSM